MDRETPEASIERNVFRDETRYNPEGHVFGMNSVCCTLTGR